MINLSPHFTRDGSDYHRVGSFLLLLLFVIELEEFLKIGSHVIVYFLIRLEPEVGGGIALSETFEFTLNE